jgi:hypothetical protein
MVKNLLKKIIIGSAIVGGLAGCLDVSRIQEKVDQAKARAIENGYFSNKGVIAGYPALGITDKVDIAVGDLDSDGDLDILTAASGRVKYSENLGESKYSDNGTIIKYPAMGSQDEVALTVGDMDNDGDLDVLVAVSGKTRYFENNLPQKNKILSDKK